jgi:hypothetical protein
MQIRKNAGGFMRTTWTQKKGDLTMKTENYLYWKAFVIMMAIAMISGVIGWRCAILSAQAQVPLQSKLVNTGIVDEWHSLDRLVRVTGWESADSNLAVARELRGIRIQLDRLNTNLEKANTGK